MLKSGLYKMENDDNISGRCRIVMEIKETDKSFVFRMIYYDNRYGYDHLKLLFTKTDKAVVRKKRSRHAMRIWSETSFTIYPFQAGIPFPFDLIESEDEIKQYDRSKAVWK